MSPFPFPIQVGSVFYIYDPTTYIPHFYVVVNTKPILSVMITGSIDNIRKMRLGNCPPETVIGISQAQYPVLYKPSIIDCNVVHKRTLEQLTKLYRDGKLKNKQAISEGLLEKIKIGILASPVVDRELQDIMRANSLPEPKD